MPASIKLTQGRVSLVDDADFDMLMRWKWCYAGHYAARNERVGERVVRLYMHRVLCPAPVGKHVDHIDGNRLNNQRSNLRIASVGDNVQKALARKLVGISGYRGVSPNKLRWGASIRVNYKTLWLGNFADPADAARAYDAAAIKHFGELAYTNFPKGSV